jgi:putative salt-induced outer membrane protein YdiY
MTLVNRRGLRLGVAAALSLSCGAALAQDKPAEQSKWETTAAAGATLTRGNSETFLGTLSLDTKRKWASDEAAFGITGGYGEAEINGNNEETTEYVKGFGQYNRLFNERLYGGIRADGEYDGIAGVDYRFRISPLIGYYVVKNPRTTLAFEAGPSVVFEQLKGNDSDTYLGARFGERFEHKLTDTTKIWQSFEYIPDVERWSEKYLIVAEAGIDAAITKKMGLRVVLQDNYDSEPSPGRDGNDIRLIAGVSYKF